MTQKEMMSTEEFEKNASRLIHLQIKCGRRC